MMIYLIVAISYVAFVYAGGIYAEAELPKIIARWQKSDLHEKMSEAEYQRYAWATSYHTPNVVIGFAYVVALQAKSYDFAHALAVGSLLLIGGLLFAVKYLPSKEVTP
jgi:hypothetical protein